MDSFMMEGVQKTAGFRIDSLLSAGEGERMRYTCSIDTPLGMVTASAEDGAVTGLWFAGQKYYPDPAGWAPKPDYPVFKALGVWLTEYFAGARPPLEFTLRPRGSPFQKRVWELLADIPYGEVCTYGDIARRLALQPGSPSASARAVGGAVGHNPISILIPCHRVVGSTGNLTGYAGGLERKKALLQLETPIGGFMPPAGGPLRTPGSLLRPPPEGVS